MRTMLIFFLFLINAFGQDDFFGTYSYDDDKILFYTYRFDHRSFIDAVDSELMVMDSDGKYQVRVTNTPNQYMIWPHFLPNGDIIFSQGQDMSTLIVFTMKLNGEDKTKVDNGGVVGSISSMGDKISIISYPKNSTKIYSFKEGKYQFESSLDKVVFFSPNWRVYVFTEKPNGSKLYLSKTDQNTNTEVIDQNKSIGQISWSNDSTELLYVGVSNEQKYVIRLNINSKESVELTDGKLNVWRPSFSKDGSKIVYSASPDKFGDDAYIYEMNLVNGKTKKLTGK